MTHQYTRRTILGGIAGATMTALAGCSSGPSSAPAESPEKNDYVEEITSEGTSLKVEVNSDKVDALQLNYEGERVVKESIPNSSVANLSIGYSYTPGEHTLLGLQGEEELFSQPVTIKPNVQVTDVGLVENNPEKVEDIVNPSKYRFYLKVENTGNGADKITGLVSSETPRPLTNEGELHTGFENSMTALKLPAGKSVHLVSNSAFFALDYDRHWECGKTYKFDVKILLQNQDQLKETLSFSSNLNTEKYDSGEKPERVIYDACAPRKLSLIE